jgi:hypothetical protein
VLKKILLENAKFSDKSFDSYYIELPKENDLPNDVDIYFSDYHIGVNHIFYLVAYIENMSQFPYKFELYAKDISTGETELLYQSSDNYKIKNFTDLCSTSKYIFWSEDKFRGDYQRIFKMDLKSRQITEIKKYKQDINSSNYINLEVSNEFLTWFETEKAEDGYRVKGVIYNPVTNKLSELTYKDMVIPST